MTQPDDPLLPFLLGELERIEAEVGLRARLAIPTIVESPTAARSAMDWRPLHWTYRFTWQQVERSRRYVWSLPRERMSEALEPRAAELQQRTLEAIRADPRVPRSASLESMSIELQRSALGGEVSIVSLADGGCVGFPREAWALALPVTAVQRQVRFRQAPGVYTIRESIQVGPLRLLHPEVCRALSATKSRPLANC